MKTLKELLNSCILIASFKQPNYFLVNSVSIHSYKRSNSAYLFYNPTNRKFYVFKYINDSQIKEFDNYFDATFDFYRFINILLNNN